MSTTTKVTFTQLEDLKRSLAKLQAMPEFSAENPFVMGLKAQIAKIEKPRAENPMGGGSTSLSAGMRSAPAQPASPRSTLPTAPDRKNFTDQEEYEEALGFWQSRVGRIHGLVQSVRGTAASKDSPATSAGSKPAPSGLPKK